MANVAMLKSYGSISMPMYIYRYVYIYIYIYVEMQFSRDEHPELPAILGFTRGTVFWPISKLPKAIIPGHRNGCFDGSYGPGLPSHNADLRVSMGLSRVKKNGSPDIGDTVPQFDGYHWGKMMMMMMMHWIWGYPSCWGKHTGFPPLERRKSGISISCFRWTSWFSALKGNPYRFPGTSTVDMARCKEGPSMPSFNTRCTNHTVVPTKTATASLTSLKYLDMSQAMPSKPIRIPMFHRPSTCKWGPTSCARSQLCNSTRSKALMLP